MKNKSLRNFLMFTLILSVSILMFSYCNVSVASANSQVPLSKKDFSKYRKTYISNDNTEDKAYYETLETNSNNLPFESLTELSLGSSQNNVLTNPVYNKSKGAYVFTVSNASDLSIYLKTKKVTIDGDLGNSYKLSFDSFGNTQKGDQTPRLSATGDSKVFTGQIGTGALIVQKSYDGKSYTQTELDKFNSGYYTTNYLEYFGGNNKEIYVPKGDDIKRGVYISVNFYYEVYRYEYTGTESYYEWWQYATLFGMIGGPKGKRDIYKNVYKNIRETYTFYIIEDNVETVTFNNLTNMSSTEIVEFTKPTNQNSQEYDSQIEQYNNYLNSVIERLTPTMYDGDMTTNGFRINVTANPYLKISLKRNGIAFPLPSKQITEGQIYYEVTQMGKYDIIITSYSKQKKITIYVDNVESSVAYQRYFGKKVIIEGQIYGDEFLDYSPDNIYQNLRVFDSFSQVPVFVGPLTVNLKEYNGLNTLPLYGVVTNKSTGVVNSINGKQLVLTDNGEYELFFFTNADYYEKIVLGKSDIQMSGDVRIYKFKFKIVSKNSHSSMNEQLLSTSEFKNLSIASPSDYNPKFYGVTRTSSNKGKIIIAFADRESALKYAKSLVWGEIETYTDRNGNRYWLIPNIDNPVGAKVESYSGWQNAQTVNTLAEQMVEEHYFDLTKSSSYLTLEKNVSNFNQEGVKLENLHLEELKKTIIIWYSTEQRNAALLGETFIKESKIIKYVGSQNTAVLSKDEQGYYAEVNENKRDYHFVKDALGIDSHTIIAENGCGNKYLLNYEDGLFEQLSSYGCKSGMYLITERNIYGNITAQYYIYYVEKGYQPATISLIADGREEKVSNEKNINIKTFKEVVIKNIFDFIDPYTYVRIRHTFNNHSSTSYFSISDVENMRLSNFGEYEIAIIDRFGNDFLFTFRIE